MPLFQLASETLQADIPFPELLPSEQPASLCLVVNERDIPPAPPATWLRRIEVNVEVTDEQRLWVATGKLGDDYLFQFPRYADFLVSCSAGRITCFPRAGQDQNTLRHLFLDHVLPLVLGQRGFTVLHASAVVGPAGGALAFLGSSGAGKSTFAASLCERGYTPIADDCILLREVNEQLCAFPLYPGLRLWENSTDYLGWETAAYSTVASYTEKKRVPLAGPNAFHARPEPLSAIFLFNPDGEEASELSLRTLSPSAALVKLLESSYCLDPGDRKRNELDFQRLTRLVQNVPLTAVKFPYDLAQLPSLREAILAAATSR